MLIVHLPMLVFLLHHTRVRKMAKCSIAYILHGLRMDNSTIRIAVGLRLGVPFCNSHTCRHCGSHVNDLATHGLSCRWSEGRHSRHSNLYGIIHRALSAAKIPSRLEPSGVARSDGKRPDGYFNGSLERGETPCVGCYMQRHLGTITSLHF